MSSKLKLHARRRAARFGDLDSLLAEALKAQLSRPQGEGSVKRIKGINAAVHETFANPDNWDQTGVVLIIYIDEKTGEQFTIGKFQERIHRRTGGRQLHRVEDDLACCKGPPGLISEIWKDPYLIGPPAPYCPPAEPANPYEKQAIRDYLSRTREPKLDELLGSKIDAAKLLRELKQMGVVLK
jgi:hypothetical protein